jgi:hypothetical protein
MKQTLDFQTQLHCVPVRNTSVTVSSSGRAPEGLIVEVRLKYRGLLALAPAIFKSRRVRRYHLTGVSRELYDKLDGHRTLEDLIVELSTEEKLTFLEARALLVRYLEDLMQRGLVVIASESRAEKGETQVRSP